MIISKDKKAVFVGIPHTGSTFFHRQCPKGLIRDSYDKKHFRLRQIKSWAKDHLNLEISDYKTFCVVRHPALWMRSKWQLEKRKFDEFFGLSFEETKARAKKITGVNSDVQARWLHSLQKKYSSGFLSLEDFVKDSIVDKNSIFKPYFNSDSSKDIEILKFENFEETYTRISEYFGFQVDVTKKINCSTYTEDISSECREIMYENFKHDYLELGYEK